MPLNYSKWDQLELSDDSDIEGHPNVDKKSLIRWKQRDIHEKREARKAKIQAINAEIACNGVLLPRLQSIQSDLSSADAKPLPYISQLVEKLQTNPSPDAPPTNAPGQPTYDAMVLSLLMQVSEEAKKAAADKGQDALVAKIKEGLDKHVVQLGEHTEKLKKDLADEEKEQKKHITSEDIHEGFDSKYVPAPPEPAPIKNAKLDATSKGKGKAKETVTEFETLNSPATLAATPAATASTDEDIEEDDLPELTPSLEAFSKLPLHNYEMSWKFIQSHRDVIVPGASDALLVASFRAQSNGHPGLAKQCVHQSLLLQYCEKLGPDGVRLFFQKMVAGDKRAVLVFEKDVEDTYAHLVQRVLAAQEGSGDGEPAEQIQLVPENPSQTISFNVPDGPPPENITLEGPGTEGLDIEEVRKALQLRWDVFDSFSKDLQDALKDGKLESVNKVLGSMSVEEAEAVVNALDAGGILSFAEGGIRDETKKAGDDDEVE
ncbi:hypothetical protein HWV62_38034 [Athelia sp. TMB]|nr:hypothetical protein HWV62_38034 [Athelia sp. TMB]